MVPGYDTRQAQWKMEGLSKPDPKEQAAQIVAWAICWPWSVVWTLCVYNPFRYAGEFLLQEIQSALFEISNGQFSEIERDLTLAPQQQPCNRDPAGAPGEPVPPTTQQNEPYENNNSSQSAAHGHATTRLNQTAPINTNQPCINAPVPSDWSTAPPWNGPPASDNTASPKVNTKDLPTDSYAWTPPVPSYQFSIAEEPLRAIKPASRNGDSDTPPPATDSWFESHSNNK